ncbi:MAG TPA: hypothetical protein PK680_10460 [Novosphingobium sp.]|nr:hypothetical protein [Novosphingobium sp.]HQA18791.1 hypothetical protein [Novosphingobium sp.]
MPCAHGSTKRRWGQQGGDHFALWPRGLARAQLLIAISLLVLGASFVLIHYFHVLHELWASG